MYSANSVVSYDEQLGDDRNKYAIDVKLNARTLAPKKRGEEEFDDQVADSAQYGRPAFWDARYAAEFEPFEWYCSYEAIADTIKENILYDAQVMVAGCGSSNMLGDMADDGYKHLVGADLSRVCIKALKVRYKLYPEISFFQGTMLDTDLPEDSVDAIIDKGLLDSLLCTQTGATSVAQYIIEVERLLSDDGIFILVSHGNPEQRLLHLEQYDIDEPFYTPWIIEVQALMKPKETDYEEQDYADPFTMYFVYICRKNAEMVTKKKVKEGKLKKKKPKRERRKAPNLK